MANDLQKEGDVKEDLEKLGIEYHVGCFSEKNPDACQRLGEYLETIKKDFDKALKVYKNNCDEYSYGKSCLKYALLGIEGKGPKQVREQALTYFEKACDANSNSCSYGGLYLLTAALDLPGKNSRGSKASKGAGHPPGVGASELSVGEALGAAADRKGKALQELIIAMRDDHEETDTEKQVLFPFRKKGVDLLQKGCELNNGVACYFMSALFIEGKDSVDIVPNLAEAFNYSEKACRLGQPQACGAMSMMYMKGEGVAKDEVKSELYKAMALDMGHGHQRIEFQRGLVKIFPTKWQDLLVSKTGK